MSPGPGPQPPWQPPGGSWPGPGPGPGPPRPPWPPGGAPPPLARRPYNPLAVVAFVASFLGPVGALLGPGLGAAALAQMRARPGQRGRGLAQAAVVIGLGLVFSVVPLVVFAFLSDRPLATVPFALLFAYGVAVAFVAFRGSSRRERAGMAAGMVGGSVAVVLAVLLAVGASYAFIYGVKALGRYVGHQVRCSVTQTVHRDPTCPHPARTP